MTKKNYVAENEKNQHFILRLKVLGTKINISR